VPNPVTEISNYSEQSSAQRHHNTNSIHSGSAFPNHSNATYPAGKTQMIQFGAAMTDQSIATNGTVKQVKNATAAGTV